MRETTIESGSPKGDDEACVYAVDPTCFVFGIVFEEFEELS